jgi:hypothetical protein
MVSNMEYRDWLKPVETLWITEAAEAACDGRSAGLKFSGRLPFSRWSQGGGVGRVS